MKRFLLLFTTIFITGCISSTDSGTKPYKRPTQSVNTRISMAREILSQPEKFKLANYHISGVSDQATALKNMQATASGYAAKRSAYAKAPGGYCYLQESMLRGMIALSKKGYSIAISEIVGGGHSSRSRHYLGVAYDVTHINGIKVSWSNPYYRAYMAKARALGATEVLGPGDRNHSGHLHIAWPRPVGQ